MTEYTTTDISNVSEEIKVSRPTQSIDGVAKVLIFIGVIGFLGNSISVVILISCKKTRTKFFNMFLINQCLIDTITSALIIATYADKNPKSGHYGISGTFYCLLWDGKTLLWIFILASTLNLIILNLERYLEVCFPIFHKTKLKVCMSLFSIHLYFV